MKAIKESLEKYDLAMLEKNSAMKADKNMDSIIGQSEFIVDENSVKESINQIKGLLDLDENQEGKKELDSIKITAQIYKMIEASKTYNQIGYNYNSTQNLGLGFYSGAVLGNSLAHLLGVAESRLEIDGLSGEELEKKIPDAVKKEILNISREKDREIIIEAGIKQIEENNETVLKKTEENKLLNVLTSKHFSIMFALGLGSALVFKMGGFSTLKFLKFGGEAKQDLSVSYKVKLFETNFIEVTKPLESSKGTEEVSSQTATWLGSFVRSLFGLK